MDNDMNKQIEDLEQRIEKHCQSIMRYDETLFNLGVELGKLLKENNIQEHRPNVFIEIEAKNNAYTKKAVQIRRTGKMFELLTRNAVAKQVEEHGKFSFDSTLSRDKCEKLADDIVEKFCIQVGRTTQVEHGGGFEAEFEISGKIADVLNQYGIDLFARADVDNSSGDEEETIYDADDVDKIFSVSLRLNGHHTELDESQLTALADDLEKQTGWLLIS
jgi:UDP-N-acetylglucosamine transferase subunit ALG13